MILQASVGSLHELISELKSCSVALLVCHIGLYHLLVLVMELVIKSVLHN